MSFKVELEIAGKTYDIHSLNYNIVRQADAKGSLVTPIQPGDFVFEIESTDDATLFAEMAKQHQPQDGIKFTIYKQDEEASMRVIELSHAFIKSAGEYFDIANNQAMMLRCELTYDEMTNGDAYINLNQKNKVLA